MTKSVYLAGPAVFHPAAKALFEYLVEICEKAGLKAVTPEIGALDLSALDPAGKAAAIRKLNV